MAFLSHFCILFILNLFHLQVTTSKHTICNTISCGDIDIKFPFGLKGSDQDHNCYYYPTPTFQLSCNNLSQTILTLPNSSGDLIIKRIDYEDQSIQVNDPEGCLPKRFLNNNLNLSGSPFNFDPTIYGTYNLTFLRCPSNLTKSLPLEPISCLSSIKENTNTNVNYSSSSVIVSWSRPIVSSPSSQRCEVISSAVVPLPKLDMPMWPFWPDLNSDVGLVWTEPRCGNCAISGQVCGFSKDKSLQVGCFSGPQKSQGLPRSAKYGLAIVPGLLCMIGLSCFVCCKVRVNTHRRRSRELGTTISLEPIIPFVKGLDSATIENCPKTLLGESGLLKPSDNTCSICLSEYEPKDTLRTIPDCNHYFHARCIDEWLKMNDTCPLCRNSPEPSSTVSFSSLSPASSLSSSTQIT